MSQVANARDSFEEYLGMGFFVHPVPMTAVTLMVLNDVWLKYAWPGFVTGKLSDFAGLFFFPLFLCALICLVLNLMSEKFWSVTPRMLLGAIGVTGIGFALLKTVPSLNGFFVSLYSSFGIRAVVVQDFSDLIALSILPLTYSFAKRYWAPTARES